MAGSMSPQITKLGVEFMTARAVYEKLVREVKLSARRHQEFSLHGAPKRVLSRELGYWGGLYVSARLVGLLVDAHPKDLAHLEPPTPA